MTIGFSAMAGAALLGLIGIQPWPTIAALVFGLAFAGVPTSLAAHLSDHLSSQRFGAAFGTITLAFGIAQMSGPQLGGIIGDVTGSFTLVFVVSATIAAGGALATLRVPRRHVAAVASE